MRYIAMQLRLLLHTKFPEAPEDDILKVIGNLLYYRYMNPAIVAPDAFDVVDVGVGAESQLTPEQVCCVCVCDLLKCMAVFNRMFHLLLTEKKSWFHSESSSACICM